MQMKHQRIGRRWFVAGVLFENGFYVLQMSCQRQISRRASFNFHLRARTHEVIVVGRDEQLIAEDRRETLCGSPEFPKLWRLGIFWRAGCTQNVHDVFFLARSGRIVRPHTAQHAQDSRSGNG